MEENQDIPDPVEEEKPEPAWVSPEVLAARAGFQVEVGKDLPQPEDQKEQETHTGLNIDEN